MALIWSDWIQPEPVSIVVPADYTNGYGWLNGGWHGAHGISQAFQGPYPGDEAGAINCCWRWSVRGRYPGQYWSPTGGVSPDGVNGWDGAAGVCQMHSGAHNIADWDRGAVSVSWSNDAPSWMIPQRVDMDHRGRYFYFQPEWCEIGADYLFQWYVQPHLDQWNWQNWELESADPIAPTEARLGVWGSSEDTTTAKYAVQHLDAIREGEPGEFGVYYDTALDEMAFSSSLSGPSDIAGWVDLDAEWDFPTELDLNTPITMVYVAPADVLNDGAPSWATPGVGQSAYFAANVSPQMQMTVTPARYRYQYEGVLTIEPNLGAELGRIDQFFT